MAFRIGCRSYRRTSPDPGVCVMCCQFVTLGSEAALWRRFQVTLASRYDEDAFIPSSTVTASAASAAGKPPAKAKDQQTLTQMDKTEPKTV